MVSLFSHSGSIRISIQTKLLSKVLLLLLFFFLGTRCHLLMLLLWFIGPESEALSAYAPSMGHGKRVEEA